MGDCLFCTIQHAEKPPVGGVLYEDELVYAHHYVPENRPAYLGHVMVETKRHIPDFAGLTPDEAQAVGLLITRLSSALKTCTGAEKVYAEFYGEVTPHLHVHLMARYPETPQEYLRWNLSDWPDAPRGGEDEVTRLCQQLRSALTSTSGVS